LQVGPLKTCLLASSLYWADDVFNFYDPGFGLKGGLLEIVVSHKASAANLLIEPGGHQVGAKSMMTWTLFDGESPSIIEEHGVDSNLRIEFNEENSSIAVRSSKWKGSRLVQAARIYNRGRRDSETSLQGLVYDASYKGLQGLNLLRLHHSLRFGMKAPLAWGLWKFRNLIDPHLSYTNWIKYVEQRSYDPGRIARSIARFHYRPKISVIMPVYDTSIGVLNSAIQSVQRQHYENWELCICDDASPDARVRQSLENWQHQDARIKVTFSPRNEGISGASNQALRIASGEFVGFLDHDDELSPDALYEVVKLLQERPEADMIYSNEDRLDGEGRRTQPFYKPDWSPEYMLSCMYTCHFGVYRKRRVDELGGFRAGFDGSQDYDLVLRLSERTNQIYHIPKILYHWRMIPSSASASAEAKPYAYVAARRALSEHLQRRQIPGEIVDGAEPGRYRVKFHLRGTERVSIIVPASGQPGLLRACIASIETKTSYPNYEIVVAGNQDLDPEIRQHLSSRSHKIVTSEGPFNFSRLVNLGAKHASGAYLLLLHDDTEVIAEDWVTSMLGFCRQEGIGVVGAKLIRRNASIQRAGLILGLRRVADHLLRRSPRDAWHDFRLSSGTRNGAAVSAACMMVRKKVFEQVGGFDEELSSAYNDVDFCLKVREAGYRITLTPWTEIYHEDTAMPERRRNSREVKRLEKRWAQRKQER
jgi:GT2 family glycosyltransferase